MPTVPDTALRTPNGDQRRIVLGALATDAGPEPAEAITAPGRDRI